MKKKQLNIEHSKNVHWKVVQIRLNREILAITNIDAILALDLQGRITNMSKGQRAFRNTLTCKKSFGQDC